MCLYCSCAAATNPQLILQRTITSSWAVKPPLFSLPWISCCRPFFGKDFVKPCVNNHQIVNIQPPLLIKKNKTRFSSVKHFASCAAKTNQTTNKKTRDRQWNTRELVELNDIGKFGIFSIYRVNFRCSSVSPNLLYNVKYYYIPLLIALCASEWACFVNVTVADSRSIGNI